MNTTNINKKEQKNIEKNKPNFFLKILAWIVGYGMFGVLNVVRLPYTFIKKRAAANREINTKKKLVFPLNGQGLGELQDMGIGCSNFKNSGCGAVATFNAMTLAGCTPVMPDIVDFYEHKGLTMYGKLGVNPRAVGRYLNQQGIQWKKYSKRSELDAVMKAGQCAILLYWWVGKKGCGAHYVTVEKDAEGIKVYNVYGNRDRTYEFSNIEEFLCHGDYKRVVTMFVMDKK